MTPPPPLWKDFNFSALMVGIGAVMTGNAAASVHGNAEFFPATLCLLFVVFVQLAAISYIRCSQCRMVLEGRTPAHEYDHVAKSEITALRARMLYFKSFGLGFMLMVLMVGLTLAAMGGVWALCVGIFVLVAGWLMVWGKTPLIITPWSPLVTGILFGPVAVITTSMLQSMHEAVDPLSWFDISPAIYMSLVVGFLSANCNLVASYAYFDKDVKYQVDTFTVAFGRNVTRQVILAIGFIAAGILVFSAYQVGIDRPGLAIFSALMNLSINCWVVWILNTRHANLERAVNIANLNVLLTGLVGSILALFVGIPDDSVMTVF